MTCREYRAELIEAARGFASSTAIRSHVDGCPECSRFLEEQQALTAALGCLAASPLPGPDEFAGPVLAWFDRARSAKSPLRRWTVAAGMAAALCLALLRLPAPKPAPPPPLQRPFVSMPYTVPLSPEEPASVARLQIPVEALIGAGFHIEPVNAAGVVEADVLISQDGRVRAIRPVSVTLSN
jgi:hypothetical protein